MAAQLLLIRELLACFSGNELVIALIFFCWLTAGAAGTLTFRILPPSLAKGRITLAGFSLLLVFLPAILILCVRGFRGVFLLPGSAASLYEITAYVLATVSPYAFLVGLALPFGLAVARNMAVDYSSVRAYMADNAGDVTGGALFTFLLVYLVTPLQAAVIAAVPLLLSAAALHPAAGRRRFILFCLLLAGSTAFALPKVATHIATKDPRGEPVFTSDSPYGRTAVSRKNGQYTLFSDGVPLYSSTDVATAEETVHFPLVQAKQARHILVISGRSGMMKEIDKYRPGRVDFVELNPDATLAGFRFGFLKRYDWLTVLTMDGRAFLQRHASRYDAIIVNLPEPGSYQVNRFFTSGFFRLVRDRLAEGGTFCFSVDGYDNYLDDRQRRKISLLYRTAAPFFDHILMLPAGRIYFICADHPLSADVPSLLAEKKIETAYIGDYFYGNVSPMRIRYLAELVEEKGPVNSDIRPQLLQNVLAQWLARVASSPRVIAVAALVLAGLFMVTLTPPAFLLFTSGMVNMGCEILVIFAFQIFFGYIYLKIGLIVTVFLAGLLPGALCGRRLAVGRNRGVLYASEVLLMILAGGFAGLIFFYGAQLPEWCYPAVGFSISFVCGLQYPLVVSLGRDRTARAATYFAADIMGAACGIVVVSMVAIPFGGLVWAGVGLAALKLVSLAIMAAGAHSGGG